MKEFLTITFLVAFVALFTNAQTPCEAGFSGIYPCSNIDLLSVVSVADMGGGEMNDIWGWTDSLDGKEYVLIGKTTGTVFFDISDPVNPILLGELPTHTTNSIWRDMKTYNDYAFIVSEASSHGMQVFDLTQLRNVSSPPVVFTEDAHYAGFGKAHNIVINEAVGKAYAVGTTTFSGGLHIVDISDPLNPVIEGGFALDGYTHDAQVVTYSGPDTDWIGAEVAFNANEDAVTIVNVTDPTDTEAISSRSYVGSEYTHQCWLTEDHEYLLVNDELDEYFNGNNTTTFIWDVSDLDDPLLIGTYVNTTAAIDHNLYTRGNLIYQANYRAGLRILDDIDIANGNLSEVAYFDLFPANDNAQFNGAWSNYPYFDSQVVAVSHIEDGLFLLAPNFLNIASGSAEICHAEDLILGVNIEEGFSGNIALSVEDLPPGVTAVFDSNNQTAPSGTLLTLSNWPAADANYDLTIRATGTHYSYTRKLNVTVGETRTWYADSDGDDFGDDEVSIVDCIQPLDYVLVGGDCDDSRNDVYPDAPGNSLGFDNDCNGLVDADEALPCEGDFNFDAVVNVGDLLIMLSEVGVCSDCETDINNDNVVNSGDLGLFLNLFGSNCD